MKTFFVPALAVCALCACGAGPLPINSEPGSVSFVEAAPKDRIREETTNTTIRAYQAAKTEDGRDTRVEVAGAECTLTSGHIQAKVTTPQEIALPKYDQNAKLDNRGVPPSILVECRKGDKAGRRLIAAKPGEIIANNSGLVVVDLLMLAGSAAVASTADWRYAPLAQVTIQ